MYRFIVNSSRLGGLYRRNCDHCQRQSLAVQCSRYFSQDSNKTEQSTQSADGNAKVASENAELAEEQVAVKLSGFAKSYEEMTAISTNIDKPIKDTTSFRELFRASNFVDVCTMHVNSAGTTGYWTQNHFYISLSPRPVGWSIRKSGRRYNLSYGQRRFIHWFWLEVPLCLPQAT